MLFFYISDNVSVLPLMLYLIWKYSSKEVWLMPHNKSWCLHMLNNPIPFIFSGASETQVFDEQSPSGNDYLAEVNNWF